MTGAFDTRPRAALIYLHATQDRDQAIAEALGQAFKTAAETKIEA
ncbi:integrase [Microbispora sp. H10949]|nr:integrase [Microbispora sp. H10949]